MTAFLHSHSSLRRLFGLRCLFVALSPFPLSCHALRGALNQSQDSHDARTHECVDPYKPDSVCSLQRTVSLATYMQAYSKAQQLTRLSDTRKLAANDIKNLTVAPRSFRSENAVDTCKARDMSFIHQCHTD